MTCYPISGPDGRVTGFVCTRGEHKKRCKGCRDAFATKLCDFRLGGSKAGKTCDVALCERCAVKRGEADYCRVHASLLLDSDAWLADLIANEVDRDALYKLFPDWDKEWRARPHPRDWSSGASEQRTDGSWWHVVRRPRHGAWIAAHEGIIDFDEAGHGWDGDTCLLCGFDYVDGMAFSNAPLPTCPRWTCECAMGYAQKCLACINGLSYCECDGCIPPCPNCDMKHGPKTPCYGGFDPDTDPSETEILGTVGDR